jgi:hypothetical protein
MRTLIAASAAILMLFAACGSGNGSQAYAEPPSESEAEVSPACDSTGTDSLTTKSPLIAPPVERLKELYPDGMNYKEQQEPFPYLSVHDSDDVLLGYMTTSDFAGTTADGFVGPVPVRVFLDPEGNVLDFELLDNCETPAYIDMVMNEDFVGQVSSYRPGQEEQLDAVTLATFSSAAIIAGVTGAADRFPAEIIGE